MFFSLIYNISIISTLSTISTLSAWRGPGLGERHLEPPLQLGTRGADRPHSPAPHTGAETRHPPSGQLLTPCSRMTLARCRSPWLCWPISAPAWPPPCWTPGTPRAPGSRRWRGLWRGRVRKIVSLIRQSCWWQGRAGAGGHGGCGAEHSEDRGHHLQRGRPSIIHQLRRGETWKFTFLYCLQVAFYKFIKF